MSCSSYADDGIEAAVDSMVTDMFGATKLPSEAQDLKTLHAKIWHLALENEFLEGAIIEAGLVRVNR